jgi:hypothetical protein
MSSTMIDKRTGEIAVRDPLDTSRLTEELLQLAREANEVSEKQLGLFASLFERQHGAPPDDELRQQFQRLGRRQAAAYLDVLLGRSSLEDAEDVAA